MSKPNSDEDLFSRISSAISHIMHDNDDIRNYSELFSSLTVAQAQKAFQGFIENNARYNNLYDGYNKDISALLLAKLGINIPLDTVYNSQSAFLVDILQQSISNGNDFVTEAVCKVSSPELLRFVLEMTDLPGDSKLAIVQAILKYMPEHAKDGIVLGNSMLYKHSPFPEIRKMLYAAGADESQIAPHLTNNYNPVFLHIGSSGDIDRINRFIDATADIDAVRGMDNSTILMEVIKSKAILEKDKFKIAKRLLDEKHVDPNSQSTDGNTALKLAMEHADKNLSYLLIDRGADNNVFANQEAQLQFNNVKEAGNYQNETRYITQPKNITSLQTLINRIGKEVTANPLLQQNIINQTHSMPETFAAFKFAVPQEYRFTLGNQPAVEISILAGGDKTNKDNRNYRTMKMFFANFNEIDKPIIMQVTLQNGRKTILTLQTAEDAKILWNIIKTEKIRAYEAHFIQSKAFQKEDWERLEKHYNPKVAEFYNDLHIDLTNDVLELTDGKPSLIIDVGTGTGNLPRKILNEAMKSQEVHIIATDIVPQNIEAANAETERLTTQAVASGKQLNGSLEFYQADSTNLLANLQSQNVLTHIEQLRNHHEQEYGENYLV